MSDPPSPSHPKAPPSTSQCQELQEAHDEERRRLARALHDDAQQTLAAASMSLSMLERQATNLVEPARTTLKEAMSLLARCHQELRVLAERLHPPLLDEMGLPTALRGLQVRAGKARVDLAVAADLPRFDRAVETAAFKLIDESLTAIYADAVPTQVRLEHVDGALHVTLSGNPVGEAYAEDAQAAVERLELRVRGVGGQFRVHRASDQIKLEAVFGDAEERT
ncbi:MAG TPA: histidine kinase [Polyangia bacterium]